jgi:hypothetical protein
LFQLAWAGAARRRNTALYGCSNWNPFRNFEKRKIAANFCVFSYIQQASQASDVGSIPIARSINPVDAVEFTGFLYPKFPIKT